MSYIRFSSYDFQCDVYVYRSADGWTTHVAANRPVADTPIPHVDYDDIESPDFPEQVQAQLDWLRMARRESIGLPYDGQAFIDDTPGACAQRLEALQSLGYMVPQLTIDELRREEEESA